MLLKEKIVTNRKLSITLKLTLIILLLAVTAGSALANQPGDPPAHVSCAGAIATQWRDVLNLSVTQVLLPFYEAQGLPEGFGLEMGHLATLSGTSEECGAQEVALRACVAAGTTRAEKLACFDIP